MIAKKRKPTKRKGKTTGALTRSLHLGGGHRWKIIGGKRGAKRIGFEVDGGGRKEKLSYFGVEVE